MINKSVDPVAFVFLKEEKKSRLMATNLFISMYLHLHERRPTGFDCRIAVKEFLHRPIQWKVRELYSRKGRTFDTFVYLDLFAPFCTGKFFLLFTVIALISWNYTFLKIGVKPDISDQGNIVKTSNSQISLLHFNCVHFLTSSDCESAIGSVPQ